jgi:hypothetical protein
MLLVLTATHSIGRTTPLVVCEQGVRAEATGVCVHEGCQRQGCRLSLPAVPDAGRWHRRLGPELRRILVGGAAAPGKSYWLVRLSTTSPSRCRGVTSSYSVAQVKTLTKAISVSSPTKSDHLGVQWRATDRIAVFLMRANLIPLSELDTWNQTQTSQLPVRRV